MCECLYVLIFQNFHLCALVKSERSLKIINLVSYPGKVSHMMERQWVQCNFHVETLIDTNYLGDTSHRYLISGRHYLHSKENLAVAQLSWQWYLAWATSHHLCSPLPILLLLCKVLIYFHTLQSLDIMYISYWS